MRFVCIANPGSRRWEVFREEWGKFWNGKTAPELVLVPWAETVLWEGNLDSLPVFDEPASVRLESPGKDTNVTRLLLEAGSRACPQEAVEWPTITKGLLVRPGLLFQGFRRVLHGLRASFDVRPHLHPTACPLAIAEMFDKTATSDRLEANGIPVPERMHEPNIDTLLASPWHTTYAKLNTGSSAVGIVVLNRDSHTATTSLVHHDGQFYNTRQLRHLTREADIRVCLEFLLREGLIVQRGIPLAQIDGENFDIRVVCIKGKPVGSIFRLSSRPMTNLHLGGRRGDWDYCRAKIPTRHWLDALDHAAEAAACFDSVIAGVDLAFHRGFAEHAILEVNAFGDFFPGWTDASRRSFHELELSATTDANPDILRRRR
jgi:hypothetical protein